LLQAPNSLSTVPDEVFDEGWINMFDHPGALIYGGKLDRYSGCIQGNAVLSVDRLGPLFPRIHLAILAIYALSELETSVTEPINVGTIDAYH
jgi:hypothetical protein